jgi:hypothetical protein
MSATTIARHHFEAALAEAGDGRGDAIARAMLGLVIAKFLSHRPIADVQAELRAAADYCDPDTDFPFMRP